MASSTRRSAWEASYGSRSRPRSPTTLGALALAAGRVVVAGSSRLVSGTSTKSSAAVAVLLEDGSPAPDFGRNGLVSTSMPRFPRTAIAQPDGRIVLARVSQNSFEAFALRLRRDGQPDPTFGPGGLLALNNTVAGEPLFGTVLGIAMPEPGRLVLSGQLYSPTSGFGPPPDSNGLLFLVGLAVTTPVELLSFGAD